MSAQPDPRRERQPAVDESQPAEDAASDARGAPPATPRQRLRAALRSRQRLREAFLLQEVLGPPVSERDRPGGRA